MAGVSNEGKNRNRVLLDFHTAFHGSVFEKYHVVPIQVATLEAFSYVVVGNAFRDLSRFLMKPGNAELLKQDRDAFVNQFGEHTSFSPLPNALPREYASFRNWQFSAVVDLAEDFLDKSSEVFEEISKKAALRSREAQDKGCAELEIQLVGLALSHSSDFLAHTFHRSGMDVAQESDITLAVKMFDFCRNSQELTTLEGQDYIPQTLVHLIDFDMVGEDRKRFPLRMCMLNLMSKKLALASLGWFAEVRDRETNILIATADSSDRCGQTQLHIIARDTITQRYKPHADVPTLTRTSGYFKSFTDEELDAGYDFELHEEEFYGRQTRAFSRKPPEEKKLIMQNLCRLRKNSFCRSHDHFVSYSSELEFERLIPVAAKLASLHVVFRSKHSDLLKTLFSGPVRRNFAEAFLRRLERGQVVKHFDWIVRKFELRTSTLEECQQWDRERPRENLDRFHHLFKGSCWEDLPEDLIMQILALAVPPRRHLFRSAG